MRTPRPDDPGYADSGLGKRRKRTTARTSRKTRRNWRRRRTMERRNPREKLETATFPGRERTPWRNKDSKRRAETATSQEGRG
ncbi:hypothetical protein NDU88_003303 [Pleurodeles waltl]|uniref:Uncharacterized protein n=1 Tax=Pleurodeles waltl TaxID=8319 RepID=A0AAV7WSG8_PLEWA|nr:hypothetical protein NDU88_003303 [Pleurodeles waltl]